MFWEERTDMDKSVGIIKEIDKLGRIVIPKDYRDRLLLGKRVEMLLTSEGILIKNPEYELSRINAEAKVDENNP